MNQISLFDERTRTPGDDVNCTRVVDVANDHVDGLLSPQVTAALHLHLRGCPACRSYVGELSTTVALLTMLEPEAPAPEARRLLATLFADWSAAR